ncbi:MAG TPA: CHASE4 domain-containing protein, partial [Candidatus Acidoferrales bacterium]
MTVYRKMLLIITLTCLGLVIVLFTASRSFLLGGFVKLEKTDVQENLQRVLNTLDQDIAAIDHFTYDRASIEQTYEGLSTKSPEMIEWLMGKDASGTIQTRRMNFVILVDSSGEIVSSRGYDLATKKVIEIPESLKAHLSMSDPLLKSAAANGKLNGVLLLPEGPLLIICRPVITPNHPGNPRGFLLSARYLEAGGDLKSLERITNLALTVHRLDEEELQDDFLDAHRHLLKPGDTYTRPVDGATVGSYAALFDIYGKPALILKAEMPRRLYRQGQLSQLYFMSSLAIAGMVFAIVIMLLLQKTVVSRLSSLSKSVVAIAESGDASAHVDCPGSDEISHLGNAINSMIASLQISNKRRLQTEDRYRAFLNNIPGIATVKNKEGRITYVNELFLSHYRTTFEAIQGKSLTERLPVDISEKIRRSDEIVLTTKQNVQSETPIPGPHGILYHWLSFKFPLEEPNGEPLVGTISI